MLTRYLAYICFATASCWLLFAGGLLISAIREEPQHAWLSTGLMLTVLLPTGCTALYVYRTGFGRPAEAATRAPLRGLLLHESENKLQALQQAQKAFFEHLDFDRHLAQGKLREAGHRPASPGNFPNDLPIPYPQVLDYRERQWAQVHLAPPAADEIRVQLDSRAEWEPGNLVSLRLLTIWEQEGCVCAVCTHLPRHPQAAGVPLAEPSGAGALTSNEAFLLLLNPTNGFRKSEVLPAHPAGFGHGTSLS